MSRGFFLIGLHQPKCPHNLGGAMRAAHCYGAAGIIRTGKRLQRSAADTTKAWRHIPVFKYDDLLDIVPHDCVPVAVDLLDGAIPLPRYRHPERAYYLFGPEDGTLPPHVVARCRDKIMVPTRYCMNLAATVNVILYDRIAKEAA